MCYSFLCTITYMVLLCVLRLYMIGKKLYHIICVHCHSHPRLYLPWSELFDMRLYEMTELEIKQMERVLKYGVIPDDLRAKFFQGDAGGKTAPCFCNVCVPCHGQAVQMCFVHTVSTTSAPCTVCHAQAEEPAAS